MTTMIGLSGAEITTDDPEVTSYVPEHPLVSSALRALDGTRRRQVVALKRRWTVTWAAQTGSARTNLLAELNRLVNLSWYPPEGGGPYTVQAEGVKEKPLSGNALVTDISCTLDEV